MLIVIYYAWNNYFSSASRISISSVQGLPPGHLEKWNRERQVELVNEDLPIGLNKEIEIQVASEKWKKAKALQDRIDEERLAEEGAAQLHGKDIDNIIKSKKDKGKKKQATGEDQDGRPLLFRPGDPSDGDYFSKLERIVHLDLKGAPPLVSYLEKLFPLLRDMGATGILMEYEDMFPYSGNLSMLASAGAYSLSDLQRIQEAAKVSRLEIIPLVQTFGHMEFVLKYKAFRHLREQEHTPQVITPVKEESYTLIFNMLEQVLKAHPDARRLHLGCDEVYELGQGQSNKYLTSQKLTPERLFLQHVVKVSRHLKKTHPKIQALIWDDWLRGISYDHLAASGVPGLVEPVVWFYLHDIMKQVPSNVWDNYSKLFSHVWVASAFKGATGSAQILTNPSVHLDNNLQWVGIIRKYGIQTKKIKFRGTIVTGWQRYDHFATLCELLPVGLPSLALSLQALQNGGFGPKEMGSAGRLLRCSSPVNLEFPALTKDGAVVTQDCRFPGHSVLHGMQELWGIFEGYRRDKGLQDRISGWMTDYHIRRGISNPGQMKVLAKKLNKVMQKLKELIEPMRKNLLEIYDKWTIDEWITTNILDQVNHLNDLYTKANKFLERKEWPARPFPELSTAPAGTKVQLPAAQGGAQVVPHRFPQQSSGVAHQGAQSVSGRMQIHPYDQNRPGANAALDRSGQKQQGIGAVQKQGVGVTRPAGSQGGMLSQTLLKRPGQGAQGRPSGPGKMQPVDQSASRLSFQNGNAQNAREPSGKGQQQLRQYVPGLPVNQKQPPSAQNKYMLNQNLPQGPGANQYNRLPNQQNQGRAQNFNAQRVPQSQSRVGLGHNPQGQRQKQPDLVVKNSPTLLSQGNLRQQESLAAKGPPKMNNRPVNQQQALPPFKDQREEKRVPEVKKVHEPQAHLPARDKKAPDYKNKVLKKSDQGQDDRGLLDSFVGRGQKGQAVNDDGKDYNAEDDDELS